jgi:hypothetical protein
MTIVWPVMVSVRHIVTTMSARSSLSAGFLSSDVAAEFTICSERRLAVARVPSRRPGATQLTSVSGAKGHRHAARQVDQARLRHRIGDRRTSRPHPGHRRDVYDAAAALGLHDRRHRLHKTHRPGQVDGHDLVPHLHRQTVEVGERDRLVVGGVVDENVEPAEMPGHAAYHALHRRSIGDIAGERRGVDLMSRGQLASDAFRRIPALRIYDAICTPSFGSTWQIRCPSPPLPPVTRATAPARSMSFLPYADGGRLAAPLVSAGSLLPRARGNCQREICGGPLVCHSRHSVPQ